ncbi:unnamed protein product [Clonostachys rosea]|uniref:Shikimate dehydrogenase substrate binding N-terminal domain-containing protein n=1 Tax=Bionectria ochroleuca TaxID=29856 RepID=A0ABY6U7E9_BIOOC|nr:unnamed protein product [Clonostachys rosea]
MGTQVIVTEQQPGAELTGKQFHIFGSGISFSMSPTIHNAAFKHHQLPHFYDIRESPGIDGVAHLIQDGRFGGASVTMPHKLQVHKYCDEITETAESIGAINTLVVKSKDGKRFIMGDNTDWSGLYNIMRNHIDKTGRKPETGLVIGAGGASRAALYSLYRAQVKDIYLVNRTQSKAEGVQEAFKSLFTIKVIQSLEDLPMKPDIIVGTIPADTTTEARFANIFGAQGLCIEMAYKPRITPLLKMAQRHPGWETVTGVEVLLSQAFDQYLSWTNKEAPKEIMLDAVMAHERRPAAL